MSCRIAPLYFSYRCILNDVQRLPSRICIELSPHSPRALSFPENRQQETSFGAKCPCTLRSDLFRAFRDAAAQFASEAPLVLANAVTFKHELRKCPSTK
jgi:hypothetical protein